MKVMIENSCLSVIEKVILIEMPVSPECMMENNPQVINDPPELGNASGQDPDSSSHSAPRNCGEFEMKHSASSTGSSRSINILNTQLAVALFKTKHLIL
jgi:hypothetical protein